MAKKVYGIYPSMNDTEVVVDNLLDRGAPAECILVLTGEPTSDDLMDSGVIVETLEKDHQSLWDRFKSFFGADDYSDFEDTLLVQYQDDINEGNTLLFVEEDYLPVLTDEVIQNDTARLSVRVPEDSNDDDVIRLVEEHLRINKDSVQSGEVHLKKRVRETTETINVPVMHEELVIERVTPTSTDVRGSDFEEETFSIPLMEERVRVDKVPVVTAEYHIRKKSVEGSQDVSDSVRSEELEEVDEFGNVLSVKQ